MEYCTNWPWTWRPTAPKRENDPPVANREIGTQARLSPARRSANATPLSPALARGIALPIIFRSSCSPILREPCPVGPTGQTQQRFLMSGAGKQAVPKLYDAADARSSQGGRDVCCGARRCMLGRIAVQALDCGAHSPLEGPVLAPHLCMHGYACMGTHAWVRMHGYACIGTHA